MSFINTLAPQLHFITGKGGVGKSTFACTLAHYFAEQGFSTLLVQVNAEDTHSRYLECPPITHAFMKVEPNLEAINLDPEESLKEYLLFKLKSKRLHRLLFDNQVMQSFFRFMPSLPELNMLGKIWYHSQEKLPHKAYRYEKIVVDCPATGHGLAFLQVAEMAHKSVQSGPIAQEAASIQEMVSNPSTSCLHVVTLAQDMPVQETLGLIEAVKTKRLIGLGLLVMNGVWDVLFAPSLAKAVMESDPNLGWKEVAYRRILKEQEQHLQIKRLLQCTQNMKSVQLPFEPSGEVSSATLERLAASLKSQLELQDA